MNNATIHLNVPAALKGRWIRASRAAGMRLSDYIIQAVEAHMTNTAMAAVSIPADIDFSDLHLARDTDGAVSFDWTPIERICQASGIDIAVFRDSAEDNFAMLLTHWYAAHRANGGAPDAVQEDLIAEMQAEDATGQHFSHQPGRA